MVLPPPFHRSFEALFAPLLSIIGYRIVQRRVNIGILVVHSTLNTLILSGGVSTVWSVESLLEPEQEVDSFCVVAWCIVERNSLL